MAHIGQKLAFQAGRLFGLLLGYQQFGVYAVAFRHLFLQAVPMPRQFRIPPFDLIQHAVEGVGQHAQFIQGSHRNAVAELMGSRDALGHLGDFEDRKRHPGLQSDGHHARHRQT